MSHRLLKYFSRRGKHFGLVGLELLESRVLLSALVGNYGGLGFSGDSGSNQGSSTLNVTISASGQVSGNDDTSVGSGIDGTGPVHTPFTLLPGDGFSSDQGIVKGYITGDGNIFAAAVSQEDSDQETSLVLFLKHGSNQSNSTLDGQFNAVLWDTPDGASFTSGLASVSFDGAGTMNANITAVAQGQNTGSAFTTGDSDTAYSIGANGLFTLGDHQGGWVSADGSIVAWTTTVSAENTVGGVNVAIRPSTGHTDADLNGAYHLLASDEENGNFSSGIATITFDGSGNYTEIFTGVGDGTPGDSALPAPSFPISGTYTVADNGQIVMDGQTTGYLNADGSFAALATVPGDTADLQTGMSFLIKAPSVSPSRLTIAQQPAATTVAGQTLAPVVVDITDASGHLDVSNHSNVTLTLTGNKTGGTLGGTVTVAAVNGVATFGNLSLTTAGNYTLTASDGALTSATSKKLAITPDVSFSHLVSVQQPVSTVAGDSLAPALIVKVEDQFGNVVITDHSKVTISVVSGPSGGAVDGTFTVSMSKGVATFSKATLSTAGNYTLAATDGSLAIATSVQFSQTITQAVTTVAAPHAAASYTTGKTIKLTALLKSTAPKTIPFTGTATILDQGSNVLGTATVAANGSVKFSFTVSVANTYICTLSYPGDTNHAAITSSTFMLLVKPA